MNNRFTTLQAARINALAKLNSVLCNPLSSKEAKDKAFSDIRKINQAIALLNIAGKAPKFVINERKKLIKRWCKTEQQAALPVSRRSPA